MSNPVTDFLSWVVDANKTKQKAFVDMSKMQTAGQLAAAAAPAPDKPGAEPAVELAWKTFKDLGEAMAQKVGIVVTKDIYGKGPEEHGAAFRAGGDVQPIAEQWLTDNGFKKKGAYSWYAGNFKVDIGKDAKNTYLYITDDEGSAKKEIALKNVPGQHNQGSHGLRGGEAGGGKPIIADDTGMGDFMASISHLKPGSPERTAALRAERDRLVKTAGFKKTKFIGGAKRDFPDNPRIGSRETKPKMAIVYKKGAGYPPSGNGDREYWATSAIAGITKKKNERDWNSNSMRDIQAKAVKMEYEKIKPFFGKHEMKQRIQASKATTFDDLLAALGD